MISKIAIIGGGASGIFCAIQLAQLDNVEIHIFEKTDQLLKKVKISGGGRCNVTHDYSSPSQFVKSYPRGSHIIKKNCNVFSPLDMVEWLQGKGIELKTEADGRIFPVSNNSQTIIDCFLKEIDKPNIKIHFKSNFEEINSLESGYQLTINQVKYSFDAVVVATGGATNNSYLSIFSDLDLSTVDTVPSLFTFKTIHTDITELMGISVPTAEIKILGSKLSESGPLLITHWGFSGPAVLKLSAWGAFDLAECQYKFKISIHWDKLSDERATSESLNDLKMKHPKASVYKKKLESIPQRLWHFLLTRIAIPTDLLWAEISKKQFNKLLNELINSEYEIDGKTTFKDEFVTAGGISLGAINAHSMESISHPNLYFIGEVLNVDGITGGYNFQNAWTSAYVAAQHIISRNSS